MLHFSRGLAVLTLGAALIGAGFALAHGPSLPFSPPSLGNPTFGAAWFPDVSRIQAPKSDIEDEPRVVRRKHLASTLGRGHTSFGGQSVCVRLCDGSFFPATSAAGGDAGCASQCPGAPTELYAMTSDKVEDSYAVSTGVPYTKLPVASRFQKSHESTCSCLRDGVAAHANQLLHDNSLRKGDVVMTLDGFKVFEGSGWGPSRPQDFVALGKAGLPREQHAQLSSMEHASESRLTPAAPAAIIERVKGNVTVDDGPR